MDKMDTDEKKATESRTGFLGEKTVEVEYLDGRKENIRVFGATLRNVGELNRLLYKSDIPGRVEFYAKRKLGWADKLTDESMEAILRAGNEMSVPTLRRLDNFNQTDLDLYQATKGEPFAAPEEEPESQNSDETSGDSQTS